MSTRAAVSQLPLLAIPSNLAPLGKLAGLFVAPVGLCAAAHQFARKGCSHSLRAVLLAAPLTLRSWGHESSFQSGLRNSPYIRARQHRCCECLARDCSAGFNEQLILSLRQTGGPVGRPSTRLRPAGKTGGVFLWSSAAVLRDRQTWADHFPMIRAQRITSGW